MPDARATSVVGHARRGIRLMRGEGVEIVGLMFEKRHLFASVFVRNFSFSVD